MHKAFAILVLYIRNMEIQIECAKTFPDWNVECISYGFQAGIRHYKPEFDCPCEKFFVYT